MMQKPQIREPKVPKKIKGKHIALELMTILMNRGFRKYSKARPSSNECNSHYLGKNGQPFRLRIADHPVGVQNVDIVVSYIIPEDGITHAELLVKAEELEKEYFEEITKRRTNH